MRRMKRAIQYGFIPAAVVVAVLFTFIFTTSGDDRTSKKKRSLSGTDKRLALVIGNGDYKTAPLRNPVNDADDMAEGISG